MRLSIILLFLGTSLSSFGQNDAYMLWTELGVRGDVIKKMTWEVELNTRFDNKGIATFFPQVGLEYKVTKWFKPSVEYRFIVDKNKYGNYKSSNRLNFNANFKKGIERFDLGLRIRYQYAFDRLSVSESYDADFDQAIRLKPSISYDIKKSIFVPTVSAEFFYNPEYGPGGRDFTKVRIGVGTKL
ncbi:MAG: DUF2490 domain-containing protein, partial [Crocinitomicaceae bacterium]|nr:DUF2490 domain-containing protein [Crocinitomicaceae bacterium]